MPSLLVSESEFPIWPAGTPGARGSAPEDIPTLTVFLPEPGRASGASFIVCPGGSYVWLAPHEGENYARWLAENGVTAFVLKSRLGGPEGYRHPAMLQDAARALRIVRAHAPAWNLDPTRVGIIGSSAGGHLAATLLTHYAAGDAASADPVERVSSRPDLGVLCYAVTTMGEHTHSGSRDNLLGAGASPALLEDLSNEKRVTADTPPCFVWHTWEDSAVKVENSIEFARALRQKGVRFDLHVYEKGEHGRGLGGGAEDLAVRHPWTSDLLYWLRAHCFIQ